MRRYFVIIFLGCVGGSNIYFKRNNIKKLPGTILVNDIPNTFLLIVILASDIFLLKTHSGSLMGFDLQLTALQADFYQQAVGIHLKQKKYRNLFLTFQL